MRTFVLDPGTTGLVEFAVLDLSAAPAVIEDGTVKGIANSLRARIGGGI